MKNYKMNEKLQKSHFLFRGFLSKQSKDIEKTRETILCTSRVRSRLEILSRAFLVTMAKTELLYPKNVGAKVAMDFT